MTIKHLCEQAGISRQWLNHLVDLGEVPGVVRKENDRLQITANPDLGRWAARKRDLKKKRELKRDELKARKTGSSSENGTSFTSKELAQQIGCTISSIHQRVLKIPGAYFDGSIRRFWDAEKKKWRIERTLYRFTDTPELQRWIETEVTTRLQEKERRYRERLKIKELSLSKAPFLRAGAAVSNARVKINRVTKVHPIKMWGQFELQAFHEDLQYMVNLSKEVGKERSRRKEQSKLTASYSD